MRALQFSSMPMRNPSSSLSCNRPISRRSSDAIHSAILDRTSLQPRSAVLAVAGPVVGDEIQLTNCPWVVHPRAMIENLGLHDVVVLNDFEAQALAVVALGAEHMEKIGPARRTRLRAVSCLARNGSGHGRFDPACHRWIPVPGEGGHMDIGPRTPRDHEVFPHIEPMKAASPGSSFYGAAGLSTSTGQSPRPMASSRAPRRRQRSPARRSISRTR